MAASPPQFTVPDAHSVDVHARFVEQRLASYRRGLQIRAALYTTMYVLGAAAILPLVAVLADHALPGGLPLSLLTAIRWAWLAVAGAVLLALLVRIAIRPWNTLFLARRLEESGEIRHNTLIATLLLRRLAGREYAYHPLAERAAAELRERPRLRVRERGYRRTLLAVLVCALAAWLGYMAVSPKAVWPSLARFFGAPVAAPTATQIELVHPAPDQVVYAGEPLRITFAVHGPPVEQVLLELGAADAGRSHQGKTIYPLRRDEDGARHDWHVQLAPHEVTHNLAFACRAGDATLTGIIPVTERPGLVAFEARLEPPAYTKWPAEIVTEPDLNVLAGTRARLRLTAQTPINEGVLIFERDEVQTRTRLTTHADDPRRLEVSWALLESGAYWFELTDEYGRREATPERHFVNVRPDKPPEIEIISPAAEEIPGDLVDVTRHPVLVAAAADDVGLGRLQFARESHGLMLRRDISGIAEVGGRRLRVEVEVGDLDLGPEQRAEVWFEVWDNRAMPDGRPAPQFARSRAVTLFRPEDGTGRQGGNRPGVVADPRARGEQAGTPPAPPSPEQPPIEGGEGETPQASGADEGMNGGGDGEAEGGPEAQPGDRADATPGAETRPAGDGAAMEGAPSDRTAPEAGEELVEELGELARENAERIRQLRRRMERTGSGGQSEGSEQQQSEGGTPQENTGQRGADGQSVPPTPAEEAGSRQEAGQQQSPERDGESSGQRESAGEAPADKGGSRGSQKGGDRGQSDQPPQPPGGQDKQGSSERPPQSSDEEGAEGESVTPSDQGQADRRGETGPAQPGGQPGQNPDPRPGTTQPATEPPPDEDSKPPSPLPPEEAVQPDAVPLAGTASPELLDLLEILKRRSELDEAQLVEAGWSAPAARNFIKRIEALEEKLRRAGGDAALQALRRRLERLGTRSVQVGEGVSTLVSTEIEVNPADGADISSIAPPEDQEVPAHLEALLKAYYETLAREKSPSAPER